MDERSSYTGVDSRPSTLSTAQCSTVILAVINATAVHRYHAQASHSRSIDRLSGCCVGRKARSRIEGSRAHSCAAGSGGFARRSRCRTTPRCPAKRSHDRRVRSGCGRDVGSYVPFSCPAASTLPSGRHASVVTAESGCWMGGSFCHVNRCTAIPLVLQTQPHQRCQERLNEEIQWSSFRRGRAGPSWGTIPRR